MIPDGAVDAAARALYDADAEGGLIYPLAAYMDAARAALEAAAPHLMAPILALADQWHAQGEDDMAVSKTIQDEHISTTLLAEGAAMVENARHIRNAIEGER